MKTLTLFCRRDDIPFSMKDVYDELWRGRDFELTHFWQRAVFLSAFLFGCYIAYWELWLRMIEQGDGKFALYNVLAIFVSMVGICVSILWILMAKGSKAWYEMWEDGIYQFVEELARRSICGDERLDWAGFHFGGNIKKSPDKKPDFCILTTRAGKFSPSRINIAIGQLSALLFGVAFVIHILMRFNNFTSANEIANVIECIPYYIAIPVIFLIAFLFVLFVKHRLVSNDL